MRIAIVAVMFLAVPVLVAADEPTIKSVDLKAKEIAFVMPKEGRMTKPTEIKTADELAKSPLFGVGAADKLNKEVSFDKEKLVVFAWSGSGGDKLSATLATVDKKNAARFNVQNGKTFDLRQHFHVYVVPKDAEVTVITGK